MTSGPQRYNRVATPTHWRHQIQGLSTSNYLVFLQTTAQTDIIRLHVRERVYFSKPQHTTWEVGQKGIYPSNAGHHCYNQVYVVAVYPVKTSVACLIQLKLVVDVVQACSFVVVYCMNFTFFSRSPLNYFLAAPMQP